jgi:hypothetical protein
MKKVTLAIAMAALVMFAGCKKDKETTGTVLKASIEQNTSDRTSLHPNGTTAEILWTAGDKILVNNGTSNATFTLATIEDDGKTGTFNYAGDYTFGVSNVAVYPETATINGNTVSLTLPETQTFTAAGTFGNGANPMLGTFTDPDDLVFTSLCGVLGVSLTGDDLAITGIEIVSNTTTDKLNGLFEADCTAAVPVLAPATGNSGTNRVMLNCAATLTTAETQEFYFVLPVGVLANGFTMNVYYGGSEPFSKSTQSTELAVEWNTVKVMSTVEVTVAGGGDEHEYVDLGLPSGLLWATCNVGANAPEEYGDYFAWGETEPKDYYYENTYTYSDNPAILPSDHDAATANWGDDWRMPTKAEFEELYNNTTMTWTTQNGVNGRLFTAANGSSLFLPAAGYRGYGSLHDAGSYGYYWSSSLYADYPYSAFGLYFYSGDCYMILNGRDYGLSVRAVRSARQN